MLDVPPSGRLYVAMRAGAGAPPLAAVPIAHVVPALTAGPALVGHLIPVEAGRAQTFVGKLVAVREDIVVGRRHLAAAHTAAHRRPLLDGQRIGRDVINASFDGGVDRP